MCGVTSNLAICLELLFFVEIYTACGCHSVPRHRLGNKKKRRSTDTLADADAKLSVSVTDYQYIVSYKHSSTCSQFDDLTRYAEQQFTINRPWRKICRLHTAEAIMLRPTTQFMRQVLGTRDTVHEQITSASASFSGLRPIPIRRSTCTKHAVFSKMVLMAGIQSTVTVTRKPSYRYRKDDRAMRPIAYMGSLEFFGSPCIAIFPWK